MSAQFELALSQQLARLRALERAFHDEGPWSFRAWVKFAQWDWMEIDVERDVRGDEGRVVFAGTFWCPDECEVAVDLLCKRDTVSTQTVRLPSGSSRFEWELGLEPIAA
jgi:hypothetical protein